jgi:hypothetical protein
MLRLVITLGLLIAITVTSGADPTYRPGRAAELARKLLDDAVPQPEREAIVRDAPELSSEMAAAMVADLPAGTKEEYRRIPWIWRVSIAAGRRNDAEELRRFLELALPKPGAPLDDWRAVVLGGGLINGISLTGAWPGERIEEVLRGDPELGARWRRAIDQASAMADDERVKTGTRYDALRMLGVDAWDRRGAQLSRYLLKGVHPELQQGAIGGLADIRAPGVGLVLLSGMGHYTDRNRGLALDALLRDEGRVAALLDAVAGGRLDRSVLGAERVARLVRYPHEALRRRAVELLGERNDPDLRQ